jgi:hypothetical protein
MAALTQDREPGDSRHLPTTRQEEVLKTKKQKRFVMFTRSMRIIETWYTDPIAGPLLHQSSQLLCFPYLKGLDWQRILHKFVDERKLDPKYLLLPARAICLDFDQEVRYLRQLLPPCNQHISPHLTVEFVANEANCSGIPIPCIIKLEKPQNCWPLSGI